MMLLICVESHVKLSGENVHYSGINNSMVNLCLLVIARGFDKVNDTLQITLKISVPEALMKQSYNFGSI